MGLEETWSKWYFRKINLTQAWGEREEAPRKETKTEGSHEICVLGTEGDVIYGGDGHLDPLQQTSSGEGHQPDS